MGILSRWVRYGLLMLILIGVLFVLIKYYSFVFSKNFAGQVAAVERVTEVTAIVGTRPMPSSQLYSFSLSLRLPTGEMVTSTSEDRQWAVVRKGQCVEAKFYPYPPWELDKAGTYFNARLLKLADCSSEIARKMGLGDFSGSSPDQVEPEANGNSQRDDPQADPGN